MVAARYLLASTLATLSATSLGAVVPTSALQKVFDNSGCDGSGIVGPDGRCNGDGIVDQPSIPGYDRDGFKFENPSTRCKYVSQPQIYDSFKAFQTDMGRMFTLVNKDVDFTIVGHQPVAGHYNSVIRLFVNAIRRVSSCLLQHADQFRVIPLGIHGGCDSDWSVQEVQFKGITNAGDIFDVVNVWVTRWHNSQIVEARVYTDSQVITELLLKNEIWTNSTTYSVHSDYIPGPTGMPDLRELEDQLGYPDGRKYT